MKWDHSIVVESIQKMIEEEKKANPKLSNDFENSEIFAIGVKFGIEAMYEFLTNHHNLTDKNTIKDK